MKKTVIIAIFVIYLASIVVVQIFGVPVVVPPPSNVYITGIQVTGVELTNPQDGQDTTVEATEQTTAEGKEYMLYAFKFVPGEYTKDEESLQNNPNRVKINYILQPDDANKDFLNIIITGDEEHFHYIKETDEIVFLKKRLRLEITLSESQANLDVQDYIVIRSK